MPHLKRSAAEIKELMFSAGERATSGGAEVVSENNVNRALVRELHFFSGHQQQSGMGYKYRSRDLSV